MRQRHDDDGVDRVGEDRSKLENAVLVGAIAVADRDRAVVQPDDVAPLEAARLGDFAGDWHAEPAERRLLGRRLARAKALAHPAEDDAPRADDGRIARVDRILVGALVGREEIDLRARALEDPEKRLVFLSGARERGGGAEVERLPLRGARLVAHECLARMLDHYAFEAARLGERVSGHAASKNSWPSPT